MGLRKHGYALILCVVLFGAVVATLLSGVPSKLPAVALGSSFLLHIERVLAVMLASYLVMVVVGRAWKGELAVKISKDGLEFPQAAIRDTESAARAVPIQSEEVSVTDGPAESILSLRLELERKMSYIATHLLSYAERRDAFVTIGGLRYDEYITDDEARAASWLLTLRDEELDTLPANSRAAYLRNAEKVVESLRMSVFYVLVCKLLKENEWLVDPIPTERRRADLHAIEKGTQRQFRIVPRFAMASTSEILQKELDRLEELIAEGSRRGEVVIVVPDRSNVPPRQTAHLSVVRLAELKRKLSLEKDPRAVGGSSPSSG